MVRRTMFPTIPPRVEYELTDIGRSLLAPVMALTMWADANRTNIRDARLRYDAGGDGA
jgi:DNA-binding HxlR family transcriptional regulator